MNKIVGSLYEELLHELQQIALQSDNLLHRTERSYQAVQTAIQQVNAVVVNYTFKSEQEEILFFKENRPRFIKELFYHYEIYYIESFKPMGSIDLLRQHYNLALERIRNYFTRNQRFYCYYRTNKTCLDHSYYLRGKEQEFDPIENPVDIDHRCSTVYSTKLAKLQAFEEVNEYLQTSLYKLENPEWMPKINGHKFKNIWTDSKTDLLEIVYLFFVKGSVNHGKANLAQLVADVEILFNINLGNYTRTFSKMKMRKKNLLPYLDDGRKGLVDYMEEDLQ